MPSAEHISSGLPIPPQVRIGTFDPNEWEEFTEEWAYSLEGYSLVRRFAGAGDQGLDVVGYVDEDALFGVWDNYQCKRYKSPLSPTDIYIEIGKIIFYSFKKEYIVPRKHYFIASKGIGSSLSKLLQVPQSLKEKTRENWSRYCCEDITRKDKVELKGELLDWFEKFDFSIFSYKTALELIEQYRKTCYYAYRFGGGLPPRPKPEIPSFNSSNGLEEKSQYIQQILNAYSEKNKRIIEKISDIPSQHKKHFLRQRGYFYHAEALRNFARDTVPPGTFERLTKEIYDGVIEVVEEDHDNGLQRMNETLKRSGEIVIHSNPLLFAVEISDKKGICHHLANDLTHENYLEWIISEEVDPDESSI